MISSSDRTFSIRLSRNGWSLVPATGSTSKAPSRSTSRAGHFLHPLPQVAIGVGDQFGVARLDLGADLRDMGIAEPHPEIIRLGHRHEGAAHAELVGDALRAWVVARIEQAVEGLARRLDIVGIAGHEIPHRPAELILQRLLVRLVAEIIGGGQDAGAVIAPGQGVEVVVVAQRIVGGVDRGEQLARDQVLGVTAHGAVGAVIRRDLVADAQVVLARRPDGDRQVDEHRPLAERDGGGGHDEKS